MWVACTETLEELIPLVVAALSHPNARLSAPWEVEAG